MQNNLSVGADMRIDSRLISPRLNIRHRQLLENIRKYSDKFEQLGLLPFQTQARSEGSWGGGEEVFALLNEDQCYFLLTLSRNSDEVVQCKLDLVKAFKSARSAIVSRDNARLEGKQARLAETAAIKRLVDYATDNGSRNAKMYYVTITKMVNEILGIESGQRDQLDEDSLRRISLAETAVDIAIRDGLKLGLEYKQIYSLAKSRCAAVVGTLRLGS